MKCQTIARTPTEPRVHHLVLAAFGLLCACASNPPPPPPEPVMVVPTINDAPAPKSATDAGDPPVSEQAAPAAAEPECQSPDDCTKLRSPGAGLQWVCENGRCLEQAAPDAPKGEETTAPAKAEKTSKKKAAGKAKGKR